ncbi:MAG: restriction endonuclease subunit S [Desulfuromonadaceae bacterium]|nr:restriction endonuclease subunit S [Desulfuromonadaceae bacterium]MDD2856350.1 restriction endonuclease subunit S [Desulfuromonadaceae bacterium]
MKAGWEYRKLGDLCDIIGGGTPSKDNAFFYENGTIPWATVRDMKSDVISETEFMITEAAVKSSSTNIIPKGNVVIATRVGLGKVCLLAHDTAINQDLKGIIPKSTSVLSVGYLFQWFKNSAQIIIDEGTGATVQGVKLPFIKSLIIPFPPLPEQQRIVTILDEAFDGIATAKANAEKNLQNARALFDSHLQSVFSQRGEGWVEKQLSELCQKITKGSSPKWQGIGYVDKPGILFVTSENVGEFKLLMDKPKYVDEKFNEKDRKSILQHGDVLTNIVGASIGRTAVFNLDDIANINQAVCLLRCEPTLLNNHYLSYLLNSPVFRQILHDNEVDNARANLSLGFFSKLAVPWVSLSKQNDIVAKLDEFHAETHRLESIYQQKLSALDALKKSLLDQAFTGEL